MTETNKNAQQATAARSPEELYDLARRWIADARACCNDKAAIDEWKRELKDWGYDMSPAASDHRVAGAVHSASARRKAFDALLRTRR